MRFDGERLRRLREIKKWSQNQLANAAQSKLKPESKFKIRGGYISQIENGTKRPGPEIAAALAQALKVDIKYFYFENASLPQDVLPDLPPDLEKFILQGENIPWLKLSAKAKEHGVPLEVLEKIVEALGGKAKN